MVLAAVRYAAKKRSALQPQRVKRRFQVNRRVAYGGFFGILLSDNVKNISPIWSFLSNGSTEFTCKKYSVKLGQLLGGAKCNKTICLRFVLISQV